MFGISYGELFLLVGATAALVGTLSLSLCGYVTFWFSWVLAQNLVRVFHFSRTDLLNAFLGLSKLWVSVMGSSLYENALRNKKLKWLLVFVGL
jgi:hypothetical protein